MRQLHTKRLILFVCIALFCFGGSAYLQSDGIPTINAQSSAYDMESGSLILKGENFQKGAVITLSNANGQISFGKAKVKGSKKIIINNVNLDEVRDGVDVKVTINGISSAVTHIVVNAVDPTKLTADDVKTVIAQAVAQAEAIGLRATISVVDKEGRSLGIFQMQGAPAQTRVGVPDGFFKLTKEGKKVPAKPECAPPDNQPKDVTKPFDCGLEGVYVPSCLASITKAVTGAFLSSQGHAFSTRTASFIIQEHFPPGTNFQSGGPLFGVQFSQLLVCSDVNPKSPLGLAADPGGLPLYKNGLEVGGIGVEGKLDSEPIAIYGDDIDVNDNDVPPEEVVALAGSRGFEPSPEITGDKIIVNGIRFKYVNATMPPAISVPAFSSLRGTSNVVCSQIGIAPTSPIDTPASEFVAATLPGAPTGRVNTRLFPNGINSYRAGSLLTVDDVKTLLTQAAQTAFQMRAAIRIPINSPVEVNITVVDTDGSLLGIFSTKDAPIFGFDVSAQKARTAAFASSPTAGAQLRSAALSKYADAANADGLKLDGSIAFSDRGNGFLSRPLFPDGIDDTQNGPFSVPIENFSPFNDGLQLDFLLHEKGTINREGAIARFLRGLAAGQVVLSPNDCTGLPATRNGIQIFAGSVPLFKNGRFAGGIGVSGDGIDQDDMVSTFGSTGFESPENIRCDTVFVRGARLPFTKFPRHPNRD